MDIDDDDDDDDYSSSSILIIFFCSIANMFFLAMALWIAASLSTLVIRSEVSVTSQDLKEVVAIRTPR